MRRIIELSRYLVALPAIGTIIGSFFLMILGVWEIGVSIVNLVNNSVNAKQSVVGILAAVDTLLLATVLLVIGYGLYELFVDNGVKLPDWLEIRSLDDLKSKLIGVVVAIIAVVFLGYLVDVNEPSEILYIGAGTGAIVLALAAFTFASRKG